MRAGGETGSSGSLESGRATQEEEWSYRGERGRIKNYVTISDVSE